MSGYTKLFSSIVMSSIWEESAETRLVWVTLLALADQHGHVDGTVKSLARVSRVSLEQCQSALDCLLGPDPDDRSGVLDGRRLVPDEGGWTLVNHAAYRAKMSADERKERDRARKRESRALSAGRPQTSENVRDFQQAEQKQTRTEQERAPVPPRYAHALIPKRDLSALYEGAYVNIPGGRWAEGHRKAYKLTDADFVAFGRAVNASVEASGGIVDDDGRRLAWLDAKLAAWRAERAGEAESEASRQRGRDWDAKMARDIAAAKADPLPPGVTVRSIIEGARRG